MSSSCDSLLNISNVDARLAMARECNQRELERLHKTWDGLSSRAITSKFLESLDFSCPKLRVASIFYPSIWPPFVRGARAASSLEEGEIICAVPGSSLVDGFGKMFAYMRSALNDLPSQHRAYTVLSVLLVAEANFSLWNTQIPYARLVFTHDVSSVPMLWPRASKQWGAAPMTLRVIASQARDDALEAYEALRALTPRVSPGFHPGLVPRREDFLRAWTIVRARSFTVERPVHTQGCQFANARFAKECRGEPHTLMAPLLDFVNHGGDESNAAASYEERVDGDGSFLENAMVLKATRAIRRGEELTIDYGSHCAEEWLCRYGFVPAGSYPCGARLPARRRRGHRSGSPRPR